MLGFSHLIFSTLTLMMNSLNSIKIVIFECVINSGTVHDFARSALKLLLLRGRERGRAQV